MKPKQQVIESLRHIQQLNSNFLEEVHEISGIDEAINESVKETEIYY